MTFQSLRRAVLVVGLIGALLSPSLAPAQLAVCQDESDPCKTSSSGDACAPINPYFTCSRVNDVRFAFLDSCFGECTASDGSPRCTGFFQSRLKEIAEAQCEAVQQVFNGTCLPPKLMKKMQEDLRNIRKKPPSVYIMDCKKVEGNVEVTTAETCASAVKGGIRTTVTTVGIESQGLDDNTCSSLAGIMLHELIHSAGSLGEKGIGDEHLFVYGCAYKCFLPTKKVWIFKDFTTEEFARKVCTPERYEELLKKQKGP